MRTSEILEQILTGELRNLERALHGSPRWCKRCSRKHPPRADCGMIQMAVPAKSGRMVKRWAHPSASS